jgi:hypothetical protein
MGNQELWLGAVNPPAHKRVPRTVAVVVDLESVLPLIPRECQSRHTSGDAARAEAHFLKPIAAFRAGALFELSNLFGHSDSSGDCRFTRHFFGRPARAEAKPMAPATRSKAVGLQDRPFRRARGARREG